MAQEFPPSRKTGQRSGQGAGSARGRLQQDQQADEALALRRGACTVLVVDDAEAARYATARLLRQAGFQTQETASGQDAVDLAAGASALVLDVNLPDVNGVKVCSLLKAGAATRDKPVVLHSAVYADDLHREAGLAAGADAYLVAPLQPEELVATLDGLLKLR